MPWHLSLIKPFLPSDDVEWDTVSMERNAVTQQFTDPIAAAELKRFLQRDLATVVVMGVYFTGSWFYPAVIIYTKGTSELMYTIAVLLSGVASVDVLLHVKYENTRDVASLRQIVQFLAALLVAIPTAFGSFGDFDHCQDGTEFTDYMGFTRAENTYHRVEYLCRRIINAFPLITISCALVSFPLPPPMLVAMYVAAISYEALARVAPASPESATEVFIKFFVRIVVAIVCIILLTIRYRGAVSQLKQAIKVVMETKQAKKREEEVDLLLCAMVPSSALVRLSYGDVVSDFTPEATVLFSDMVQFTAWSSKRTAQQVVSMLNALCIHFDLNAEKMSVEKIKTIGDAYWAVTGLPEACDDHAERMCDFANKMLDIVEEQNKKHPEWEGVQLRIGIHSGELYGGILGSKQLSYEVYGETSHLAEEVEKAGTPSRVTVSHSTMLCMGLSTDAVLDSKTMTVDDHVYQLYVLRRETIDGHRKRAGGKTDARRLSTHGEVLHTKTPSGSRRQSLRTPSHSMSEHEAVSQMTSHRSINPNDLKEQRQKFLKAKAQAKAELAGSINDAPEVTLQEIEEKYSKRKLNWVLMEFADADVEKEFKSFVVKAQLQLRVASRLGTLVMFFTIIFCMLVDDGNFSTASGILFIFAGLTAFVDAVLALKAQDDVAAGKELPMPLIYLQAVVQHVTALFIVFAAIFTPVGASVITNDITWLHGLLTMLIAMGNVGTISAASLVLTNMHVLVPPFAVVVWSRTVMRSTAYIFLGQSNLIIIFFLVIMEKQYRKQFLESRVAKYFEDKQEQRNKEQAALLASIVPHHVIDELMVWLGSGMDTEKSIVRRFSAICVGFVKLHPSEEVKASLSMASPVKTVPASSSAFGGEEASTTDQSPKLSVNVDDDDCIPGDLDWLRPAHIAVDDILKKYAAIDKIKTIGDLIMIAGPFSEDRCVEEAADQMVAAASEIRQLATIQAGIHYGEIVGAVLGTNRLCFDIFGDTVNTASRCMSGGSEGDVTVSGEVCELLTGSQAEAEVGEARETSTSSVSTDHYRPSQIHRYCDGLRFGEPIQQLAKGKGYLTVHRVVEFPLVALPPENTS